MTLPFAKLCYAFEEKPYYYEKSRSKLPKNEPENQKDLINQKLIFDINQHLNCYNHPFDICLNPLIMSKEGWFVGLGQGEVAWCEGGGNVWIKYLDSPRPKSKAWLKLTAVAKIFPLMPPA